MKKKRFSVVSIHYTTECNLNCPFCYKKRCSKKQEKSREFWFELVPYVSKLTNQIALGGGEPFIDLKFVKDFGKECKKNKILLNITSNGKILMDLTDKELKEVLKNVTMVSLSFDSYKVESQGDLLKYVNLVKRIKSLTKCQVGTNLLMEGRLFKKGGVGLVVISEGLFKSGVDRIFLLCPKNTPCPDILSIKEVYAFLTDKYKHFYVDDLGKMILEQGTYKDWKSPCHYGKDLISINEQGFVTGCSFDCNNKSVLQLKNPKDILKIESVKFCERFSCPYLNI